MKRFIAIAMLMLSCSLVFAQKHYEMDLNGLEIGQTYTKEQVVARLGKPTLYRSYQSEFGLGESYYYGEKKTTELDFQRNGEFTFFTLAEKNMPILTKTIAGGICVGENISAMKKVGIPYGLCKKGEYLMMFGTDFLYIWVDEKDIITRFIYIVPD
ncbi:MAG: hypothetical protein MJY84_00725 [Bacteroidales bacterium]|nr:hypothetical protein [Bacteroidales bacterium]